MPLSDEASWLPINDKLIHLGLYGVFGMTLSWARVRGRLGWPHAVFLAIGAVYGGTDEWHQAFVPGRDPSVADWTADVIGVALGYTILLIMISSRLAGANGPSEAGPRNEGK